MPVGFRLVGLLFLCLGLGAASYYALRSDPPQMVNVLPESKPPLAQANTQVANSTVIATAMPVPENDATKPDFDQADFDNLQHLPLKTLWQRWHGSLTEQVNQNILITTALVQKLRHDGNAVKAIYTQLASLLRNNRVSAAQKAAMIDLLGEVSTPQAMAVLAKLLQEATDPDMLNSIADAIAHGSSGLTEWDLQLHPELSPILEKLWHQLEPDQQVAIALATRIAREGAGSGINLLLDEIEQAGKTLKDITQNQNSRSLAALNAMSEIRSSEALPLLKQAFLTKAYDSAAFNASGDALSAMASVDATKILLEWARSAPDVAADQAQQWLGDAAGNDPDSWQYLKNALAKDQAFHSSLVKQGVSSVLQERE